MQTAALITQGLLIFIFLLAGGAKLAASERIVYEFERFGYPLWFMFFIGAVQVLAAAGLLAGYWWPSLAMLGGISLTAMMVGAAVTHVRAGDPVQQAVPPLIIGMLAVWITAAHWVAT